jgi:hypothetical protein
MYNYVIKSIENTIIKSMSIKILMFNDKKFKCLNKKNTIHL